MATTACISTILPPTLSLFHTSPTQPPTSPNTSPSYLPPDVPGVPRTDELTASQEGDQSLQQAGPGICGVRDAVPPSLVR